MKLLHGSLSHYTAALIGEVVVFYRRGMELDFLLKERQYALKYYDTTKIHNLKTYYKYIKMKGVGNR